MQPIIDLIFDVTLARCKAVLGAETYKYDKSLVIDHDDVEEMIEEGKGRCTVTLDHLSGVKDTRGMIIRYESVIGICISVPLESSEYAWQKKYLEHMESLIKELLGKSYQSGGESPTVKFSCGTEKMPGFSMQHDVDTESVDSTSCFRGMVSFLVHVEK